jgi:hypothetical protein
VAKIEPEQRHRFLEENRIGQFAAAVRAAIEKARFVVAPLLLPFQHRLVADPLLSKLHACHVVRGIDDEEQQEGQEVHTDQIGTA